MTDLSKLAYPIEEAGPAIGVSRTRIFDAVRNNELTVRKAGKSSLIETAELKRWLHALPIRGRLPNGLAIAPERARRQNEKHT